MSRPQGALFGVRLLGQGAFGDKIKEARRYLRWRRKYAPQLRKFKGLHAGQHCFILGNGPSLNKMDLAPLADYHTFGLNKIYLLFDRVDLDLSYLVSTNGLVIEQSSEEFERLGIPTFLSYTASAGVEAAWLQVYRDPATHWDLYQLGEELTDLEDAFRLWRFRHLTTVERVIGFKRGTGGTNGVGYLRKMLDTVLFPEIWALRTDL